MTMQGQSTARILDGKALARKLRDELLGEVEALRAQTGLTPGLAVVLVGDDPASQVYVRNKERACAEVGIASRLLRMSAEAPMAAVQARLHALSHDAAIHGILLQLPLPSHLDAGALIADLEPEKDVDGFHPWNQGQLLLGRPGLRPCTPLGITTLLERHGIAVAGKRAVVVGRSASVGRPMALMLLGGDATVTVCHSRTPDLAAEVRQADLVIAAIGRPRTLTAEMIKPGAVVVDVGISPGPEGGLVGDVDFGPVAERASWITPVPGGVGPMTVATLLANTVQAFREAVKLNTIPG